MSARDESDPVMGIVHIIGVGPGDPRLITVRGRDLIALADAIVFDSSVSRSILPADARESGHPELFDVGRRRASGRRLKQEDVNELLVRLARDGKRVARLTGGDAFVFGRGSEEAQILNDSSIPFEIVPGVTAGIAAAAYAGIPVTHRGLATSVTFVAGSEVPGRAATQTDWSALAKLAGTIVIYMGESSLREIADLLVGGGMPEDMPAAVVQRGTRMGQRTLTATVGTIAERAADSGIASPSIIVIGWTAILRDELSWFENRALFGKRIVVAHGGHQSEILGERLRDLGARVLEMPEDSVARLDLAPLRAELSQLTGYGWIIFASASSVTIFWEQLLGSGRDARALAELQIAAVGADAAGALLGHGVAVDVIPARFTGEALVERLGERDDVAGSRILLVTPEGPDADLAHELAGLGADVTTVHAYRRVAGERGVRRLKRALERGSVSAVAFTSATAVRGYVHAAGEFGLRAPAACIGSHVSGAATAAGMQLLCEAEEPTIESLLTAIELALT